MKNKIRIIFVLIIGLLPNALLAKDKAPTDTISARRAFLEMPAQILDLLSKETRKDMLIYYDNDSIWDATNEFDGKSRLVTVTPDYLKVEITPVTTMQFKILPSKAGDIVMTIYTTGGTKESKDSDIRFYDSRMNELDSSKIFKVPELKYFFSIPKGSTTKMSEIEDMMPFYTVEFNAKPGENTVTGTLSPGDFLTVEDMNIVKLFLKPTITYNWDGKALKKIN